MRFIDVFIRRPVLSLSISFMVIIVGVGSFFSLQIRQYPYMDTGTIHVSTSYPGASPAMVQTFLTKPLESSIGSVNGIDYMTSSSSLGSSSITIYIKLGYNTNDVLSQVVQSVNAARSKLPPDSYSPTIKLQSADNFPSLVLAFSSKTMSNNQISAYINSAIVPKLLSEGGLSSVDVWGNRPYAMRIYPDQQRMAEFGVTPTDIRNSISSNSLIAAGGKIQGPYIDYTLKPKTNISTAKEYRNMVVKKSGNQVIRLGDVAKVELGSKSYDATVSFNNKNAVLAGAIVSSDENPLTVVANLVSKLPSLRESLPNGLNLDIAYNSTLYIQSSIHDVIDTLIEAIIIVSIVMFLFLGSLRAVLVPLVAIPISIVGTFFLMKIMGFSINLLTLLSMILAIGLVVDDAIVVLENIYRHIEEGMQPFPAAIRGAREIANPVILMTLTLVVVYAPIGLMGGFTGQLFTEFAYSLAGSVLISGLVAYTLSPMLCSKFLNREMMSSKVVTIIDKIFTKISDKYKAILVFILEIKPAMLIVGLIVLLSCFYMVRDIKSELAPTEDQGFLGVMAQAPSSANINYLNVISKPLAKVIDNQKGVENSFMLNGAMSANLVFGGLILKPWDDRTISQNQVAEQLQAKLTDIPGVQTFVYQLPALPGSPRGAPFSFVIQSINGYPALKDVADGIVAKMMKSGLFTFVNSGLKFDTPQIDIDIDRNKAGVLGVTMSDIASTLSNAYSGSYINYFYLEGYSYEVISQLARNKMLTKEQLGNIFIKPDAVGSTSGSQSPLSSLLQTNSVDKMFTSQLPLSSLVTFKTVGSSSSLSEFNQLNSVTIAGVMSPGVSQGQVVKYAEDIAKNNLPAGYTYDFSGPTRQFVDNGNAMIVAFGFALVLIFLALSAQFESFRDSLVILVTIPMAISGALIPLFIGQNLGASWASLNIYTELGLVTLIGLISKQGIMVVEFANHLQRDEELSKYDAIVKSSSQRLRPILMTVSAMVVGVIPLVTSTGAGAVSRNAIGVVISSGLFIGALFSLFVLPVVYMYVASDKTLAVKKEKEQQKMIDNLKK